MPDIRRIATIGQLPDKMLEGISKPQTPPLLYHIAMPLIITLGGGGGACWGF